MWFILKGFFLGCGGAIIGVSKTSGVAPGVDDGSLNWLQNGCAMGHS